MQIRNYSPFDQKDVHRMLRAYGKALPICAGVDKFDANIADRYLSEIRAGRGVCLLAVNEEDRACGLLLAYIVPNMWNPAYQVMHEMAFWVDPESRGSRAGYLLISGYADFAKNLLEQKRISCAYVHSMNQAPIDYERFGFKPHQCEWFMTPDMIEEEHYA